MCSLRWPDASKLENMICESVSFAYTYLDLVCLHFLNKGTIDGFQNVTQSRCLTSRISLDIVTSMIWGIENRMD